MTSQTCPYCRQPMEAEVFKMYDGFSFRPHYRWECGNCEAEFISKDEVSE